MKEEESVGIDSDEDVVFELRDKAALDKRFFFCGKTFLKIIKIAGISVC